MLHTGVGGLQTGARFGVLSRMFYRRRLLCWTPLLSLAPPAPPPLYPTGRPPRARRSLRRRCGAALFQGGRGHHGEARRVHWQPAGAAGEDTIPEIRAQFIRGTYVRILKALYYRARCRDATLRDERFMARLKSYVTLIKYLR